MSDHEDDKGPRKNTSPEHKPENAKNANAAPRGSVGNSFTPTGTSSAPREFIFTFEPENHQQPTEAPEDTRPIAVETGIKEIDDQSHADGYQIKPMEELEAMAETQETETAANTFDEMMMVDGATHFQKTNDPQINQLHEERGEQPVTSVSASQETELGAVDNPFGSKEDLIEAFNRVKGHEIARSQTKGPEPS